MPWCTYRGQKTKLVGSQLFPTTWVPGNELSLSDLAADSFTCWAILPPFNSTFYVTAQPLNVRMNLYQLCGSSTAGYIVCRGVYKIASTRFLICRDLLILQQLLTRLGDAVSTTCGKTCKLSNPGELETCLYSVLSILGAAFQGFYRHQVTRLWREAYRQKKKRKKSQKEKEWMKWLAVQYICLLWLLLFSEVLCQLLPKSAACDSLHSAAPITALYFTSPELRTYPPNSFSVPGDLRSWSALSGSARLAAPHSSPALVLLPH